LSIAICAVGESFSRIARAAETVAPGVAAGGEAECKYRYRAQKDGAAVLKLLDHGMKTRAFVRIYEQPPGTIAA